MTTTTIELPDGGTATIRDPKDVTERQRRPVTRLQMRLAASPVGQLLARKDDVKDDEAASAALDAELTAAIVNDPEALALLDDLNDALMVALVESVNGVAMTGESALDQPHGVYDALKTESAKYVTQLMPTFSANPDPASPTPPSAS